MGSNYGSIFLYSLQRTLYNTASQKYLPPALPSSWGCHTERTFSHVAILLHSQTRNRICFQELSVGPHTSDAFTRHKQFVTICTLNTTFSPMPSELRRLNTKGWTKTAVLHQNLNYFDLFAHNMFPPPARTPACGWDVIMSSPPKTKIRVVQT